MAVIKLETLVQRGVRVVFDVVADRKRIGTSLAAGETSTSQFLLGHPSPEAEPRPFGPCNPSDMCRMDRAASRAGRSLVRTGGSASRSTANGYRRRLWSRANRPAAGKGQRLALRPNLTLVDRRDAKRPQARCMRPWAARR